MSSVLEVDLLAKASSNTFSLFSIFSIRVFILAISVDDVSFFKASLISFIDFELALILLISSYIDSISFHTIL